MKRNDKTIKRYNLKHHVSGDSLDESEDGDYVSYEDYHHLENNFTCIEIEYQDLKSELAGFHGEKWDQYNGGSEVDRLRAIIGDLDKRCTTALKERNEARSKLEEIIKQFKFALEPRPKGYNHD